MDKYGKESVKALFYVRKTMADFSLCVISISIQQKLITNGLQIKQ